MLDEDKFWEIISESLDNSSNQSEQEKYLINELVKLPSKDIEGFYLKTIELLGYIESERMTRQRIGLHSGDGWEYFNSWIISQGKTFYYSTRENPENLINKIRQTGKCPSFETFMYVTVEAFERKEGKDFFDYFDRPE